MQKEKTGPPRPACSDFPWPLWPHLLHSPSVAYSAYTSGPLVMPQHARHTPNPNLGPLHWPFSNLSCFTLEYPLAVSWCLSGLYLNISYLVSPFLSIYLKITALYNTLYYFIFPRLSPPNLPFVLLTYLVVCLLPCL